MKTKRVRKRSKSLKGGEFERTVCRQLSRWWSCDANRDDWFWRASQSGGRATVRGRKGKTTTGHCGDIAATCWQGELLTKFITFELKRGYNTRALLADLLDRTVWPTNAKQRKDTMLGFIEQARAAAERAGTPYWALIHKRDGREPVIYYPLDMHVGTVLHWTAGKVIVPRLSMALTTDLGIEFVGYRLDQFLEAVPAAALRRHIRLGVGK